MHLSMVGHYLLRIYSFSCSFGRLLLFVTLTPFMAERALRLFFEKKEETTSDDGAETCPAAVYDSGIIVDGIASMERGGGGDWHESASVIRAACACALVVIAVALFGSVACAVALAGSLRRRRAVATMSRHPFGRRRMEQMV